LLQGSCVFAVPAEHAASAISLGDLNGIKLSFHLIFCAS
jgi:hypothetical protein